MARRRPLPTVSPLAAVAFAVVLGVGATLLVAPLFSARVSLREGDRAPRTLSAINPAQYESPALTEAARDNAAAAVAPVPLPTDPTVRQQQRDRLFRLMDQVRAIRQRTDLPAQQQLHEVGNLQLAEKLSLAGRSNLLALAADRTAYEIFRESAGRGLTDILSGPVPQNEIAQRIDDYLAQPGVSPTNVVELTAIRELLRAFVTPNVQADEIATQARREEARDNTPAVIVTYSRGQVVASEGQALTGSDLEALERTGVIDNGLNPVESAAAAIFGLGFGLLLGLFLWQFQPFPAPAGRRMLLTGAVTLGVLVIARLALPELTPDREQHYWALAIPVSVAAMTTAAFSNLSFGAVVAVCVAFFAIFVDATTREIPGSSFVGSLEGAEYVMAYSAGGLAGALAVHRAERLRRFAIGAFAVTVATFAVMFAFWLLLEPRSNESLGWLALASAIHGIGAAVASLGLFVILPMILGITTRLQLTELADGEHPLLKALQEDAPGTYHHSMMVAALAERAADRIGADALLARVGAYYHDIGKLTRPGHYIENMLDGGPSPHDDMAPLESASIIRDHVSAGIELGRRHHLPPVVRDFIPEHHGTRLVSYFYRKAVRDGGTHDPAGYRYAGPRPQTRETAIVMLADSCEAVVRAAGAGGPERLEELVESVFAERLAEGQFDECDITMRELIEVAAAFKVTLHAVYHRRIAYPEPVPEELAAIASAIAGASRPAARSATEPNRVDA